MSSPIKREGFIAKIFTKTGEGKKGPWTKYSFKLMDDQGVEGEEYISFGFDKPPFAEGDYVSLETLEGKYGHDYIQGTGTISKDKGPAPAKQNTYKGKGGKGGGYKQDPAREGRIVWQHSQEMALRKMDILLQNDGLPLTKTTGKANQAKRFEELSAMLNKFEVEAYEDAMNPQRVIDRVGDAGAVAKPVSQLPEDANETPEDVQVEETTTDAPFEDGAPTAQGTF